MKTNTKYQLNEYVYCYLDGDKFEGKISNISERWDMQNPNNNGIKYTVNGKEIEEEFVFRTKEELAESNIIPDGMISIKTVWCKGADDFDRTKKGLEKKGYEFLDSFFYDKFIILYMIKSYNKEKKNKFGIGDELWYMEDNKIRNGEVIQIALDNIKKSVYYGFNADYRCEADKMFYSDVAFIEESELFRTKKELIKQLEDETEK